MSKSDMDFEFDDVDMELNEDDLDEMDKKFIQSIKEKSDEYSCDESDNAFSYWLLIILLILFVFLIGISMFCVIRGRRRRQEYRDIGYRER
jgi:hypothetical protein